MRNTKLVLLYTTEIRLIPIPVGPPLPTPSRYQRDAAASLVIQRGERCDERCDKRGDENDEHDADGINRFLSIHYLITIFEFSNRFRVLS